MCLAEDLGNNIYYQDTDSMHIEHDKIQQLADLFEDPVYNNVGLTVNGKNLPDEPVSTQ